MTLGIIGAMSDETKLIAAELAQRSEQQLAGVTVISGTLSGRKVCLCTCGVGKTCAAAACQLLIDRFGCELILNTGVAGNTDPSLGVGDTVIASDLVYHDADMVITSHYAPFTESFACDPDLVALAQSCCRREGARFKTARIASGDEFVCDSARKRDIIARTNCSCLEMEGAAIAHVAARNGVRFLVVRVMSDNADENVAGDKFSLELDLGDYCRSSLRFVLDFVAAL